MIEREREKVIKMRDIEKPKENCMKKKERKNNERENDKKVINKRYRWIKRVV